ncbi:hypothetical protein [Paenibacillus endoradicis]|uniref:hypothetical protein n=1 Tax=Paenibacillus endoradicis TaxID=2972487 RepID=UPI002159512A|nr:hypothetical protein [Paenibacillus endoradicis]MCR8656932.1 hypothetical protein [Paenibacillus endoradicis]
MRGKKDNVNEADEKPAMISELEKLTQEKISLATKLGLLGAVLPKGDSYKQTNEYRRIQEIDKLLWELI